MCNPCRCIVTQTPGPQLLEPSTRNCRARHASNCRARGMLQSGSKRRRSTPVSSVESSVIAAWPRLSILCCVFAFTLLAGPGTARAQQEVAPGYDAAAFVGALYSHAQAPKAEQFAAAAGALVGAIDAWCREPGETAPAVAGAAEDAGDADLQPAAPLGAAQAAWMAAADAWARLTAVSVGATLERDSAATLDARPTRPPQIKAAIAARGRSRQPPDEKALGRVAATAKGLPALEWLLWDRSAPHSAAACRYATGLSQEVEREAAKLAAAHGADAAVAWKDKESEAVARATEAVTQWLAGLERLRSHQLGEPLAVAAGQGRRRAGRHPRYLAAAGQRQSSGRLAGRLGKPAPVGDRTGTADRVGSATGGGDGRDQSRSLVAGYRSRHRRRCLGQVGNGGRPGRRGAHLYRERTCPQSGA